MAVWVTIQSVLTLTHPKMLRFRINKQVMQETLPHKYGGKTKVVIVINCHQNGFTQSGTVKALQTKMLPSQLNAA